MATLNPPAPFRPLPRSGADAPATRAEVQERLLFGLFLFGLAAVILLQKFGISNGGGTLAVGVPLMLGAMALACIFLKPVWDPVRIGLYFAFVAAAGLSTMFLSPVYSQTSIALLVLMHLPMVVAFETSEATYRRCLNAFVNLMLVFCAVIAVEHAAQFLVSPQAWPNLDKMVPTQWLVPGFNYLQPIVWNLPYHKPNALLFLEVSFLSQCIALALAIEIVLFQRMWRLLVLAIALMATFGGTGLLLIAITLPVLLGRLKISRMVLVIASLLIVIYVAYRLGWFELIGGRVNEHESEGSSANMRFIEPLNRLVAFLSEPGALFSGIGAGNIEKGRNFQWWPITKATVEYGLIPALIFYAFFLYALFKSPADRSIAFTLAVWYTFEGALLTAINPLTCVLLATMFSVRRSGEAASDDGRAERRGIAVRARHLGPAPSVQPGDHPRSMPRAGRAGAARAAPKAEAPVVRDAVLTIAPGAAAIEAPSTDGRLIYAFGDIHGRADLLQPLVERILADAAARPPAGPDKPLLIFLGDYIDRGRDARGVIDRIIALSQDPAVEVRTLLGNHEQAMLDYLDGSATGISFGRYGGRATLASYGVAAPDEAGSAEAWAAVREEFRQAIPDSHMAFLRSLESMIVIGDCVFVHAGVRAGVALDRQRLKDLLFIREEFFKTPVDCGKFVVHGHTPGEDAVAGPNRLCLDTGAYASGVLTAARLDGGPPQVIDVGR